MILRNVVTRYTQFDLEILLYGDSNIDHDRNAVIVQAVFGTPSDFNFAPYTMYYLQMGLIITIQFKRCIINSWF